VADRLDVAERLAEGAPAVEHTQRYVRACQALGYQHPDLTAHPAQIRDWYDTEEGLNLAVLDRDCAELRAAAGAAAEALRMQRAQVFELSAAWTGTGADAAVRFLQRHCDAADAVAAEVRAAAQRCESLRDNLWHLLDVKVATAIAIDDRTLAQRPAWLAAADTVTTGVGDRQAADELVHLQITPYVDNAIRGDWLSTMRSTQAGVTASYDMVSDRLARAPRAHFEIPGDLGPSGGGPRLQPAPAPALVPGPALVPAAALSAVPPDPVPAPAVTSPAPVPAAPELPNPATASMPDWGAAPADASAMPTGAAGSPSGLGGLANQVIEAMGDLLDSVGGDEGEPVDTPAEEADDQPGPAEEVGDVEEAHEEAHDEANAAVAGPTLPPVQEPPVQGTPVPEPPVQEPPPPAPLGNPPSGGKTPCEIAADQLPQAG
jgi:hypothetical protein